MQKKGWMMAQYNQYSTASAIQSPAHSSEHMAISLVVSLWMLNHSSGPNALPDLFAKLFVN